MHSRNTPATNHTPASRHLLKHIVALIARHMTQVLVSSPPFRKCRTRTNIRLQRGSRMQGHSQWHVTAQIRIQTHLK